MYAVGHLALGYLCGKATSKALKTKINLPLIFLISTISDASILIPGLKHRGPTHSLIMISLLALPAFTLYRKKVTPYFIAAISHSLIGDGITSGGVQLFWPITYRWYGVGICMESLINISAEWTLFLTSLTIMFSAKDAWSLLKPHPSNLLLSIPVFTVLLPPFFSFPRPVPMELIIPHLTLLTIFTLSILKDLKSTLMP